VSERKGREGWRECGRKGRKGERRGGQRCRNKNSKTQLPKVPVNCGNELWEGGPKMYLDRVIMFFLSLSLGVVFGDLLCQYPPIIGYWKLNLGILFELRGRHQRGMLQAVGIYQNMRLNSKHLADLARGILDMLAVRKEYVSKTLRVSYPSSEDTSLQNSPFPRLTGSKM